MENGVLNIHSVVVIFGYFDPCLYICLPGTVVVVDIKVQLDPTLEYALLYVSQIYLNIIQSCVYTIYVVMLLTY